MGKIKYTIIIFFVLACSVTAFAQSDIDNGSFEAWKGGEFVKCCGRALAIPLAWSIIEQPMQMATNHFVMRDPTFVNVHSGNFSAELYTDTTTIDSAGDLTGLTAVEVPGIVTSAGIVAYGGMALRGDPRLTQAYSTGGIFTGHPLWLNFWLKVNHGEPDTVHYAYMLTRWDGDLGQEDTLAIREQDIYDNPNTMDQWVEYTDTLHYLMPGEPDTLRLIFFGGRNDDPAKVGNTTWLDDVAFYYETTGLVPLDADDAVSVYPNPANNILHLKSSEALAGSQFNIIDVTGKVLISQSIENANVDFYIGNLAAGSYFYSVQPKTTHNPFTGMFSITR